MSSSFRDFVEEVRSRSDVVTVIGADVALRQSGSTFRGLSPFNQESEPSFVVWPDTQTWHDFSGGGGLGGDVFDYVQQRHRSDFRQALQWLAERAGVPPPELDPMEFQKHMARATEGREARQLLTLAAAYYHRTLPAHVREEYYRSHYGFADEVIDRLQLGWADGGLLQHFTGELGVDLAKALKTGLFVVIRGGQAVDFFRNRLVFPYWRRGQAVYFIARRTRHTADEEWERAKYKKLLTHSAKRPYVSETVRNDTFYNEDAARGAQELLVTEGVTDCISALQAGVPCLSPVTVRFRKQDGPKLVQLTRSAQRVVICNDSEDNGAGIAGALDTARTLHEAGRDVRIALIPRPESKEKIDVNELVATRGPAALHEVIAAAVRYPEHLLHGIPADTQKQDLDEALVPVLEAVARLSPIQRNAYRDVIAERFGLSKRPVETRLKEITRQQRRAAAQDRVGRSARPSIVIGDRQLRGVLARAGAVVAEANEQLVAAACQRPIRSNEAAPLFVRGGRLVRLVALDGGPTLAELDEGSVYGLLARMADWFTETRDGPVPANPSPLVARDLLVYPPAALPELVDVVATPVFGARGELILEPGYHAPERLWLQPDPGLVLAPVPDSPNERDVARARSLLLDELLGDFCFVQDADRAHALAALLLPFARRLIAGFTPLHLVESPTPGSGKGLLCNLVAVVATGSRCESRTVPTAEDDIRKMVTAELTKARPIVLLDNLPERRSLSSSALAALVTTDPWTDRVLGETRMVSLPNRALWLVTANNPALSDELARRCVRVRLDTRMEMPWKRSGFRHDPIIGWAKEQRGELVWAALVLIQAWLRAGRPSPRLQRLGSFEEWTDTMGGILALAAVPGFLANLDALYAQANAERAAWTAFVRAWWSSYRDGPQRAKELNVLCERHELLDGLRGDGSERSQQSRLGRALAGARDRVYAGHRITLVEDQGRHKGRLYALVEAEPEQAPDGEGQRRGTLGDMRGTLPSQCPPSQVTETTWSS